MNLDFDANDASKTVDYTTVPAGTYRCRIAEVRGGTTRAGDERWSLRLVVAEGEHIGKQAAWDSIVCSLRGWARAKMVLRALNLAQDRIHPAMLEGREAMVQVRPVDYTSPCGATIRRNEVPYDGWSAVEVLR